ncbi:MAG: hypothetical protein Fur0046_04470 [Cyanobacteria bacterium J069]
MELKRRLKRQLRRLAGLTLQRRDALGLLVLLVACYLGNLTRWTLFFNIDLIFGSVAVWLVVCFYGIRWGALAGLLSGACTYFLWGHPYAGLIFTLESVFVGSLFYRDRRNIVLLDGIFWLLMGMPLVWFFYAGVLQIDPVQAQIVMLKQPVNAIFNALIASLLMTYLPIHHWLNRPRALNSMAFQQTLFNLLVAFVFLPTLLLIMFASRDVVDDIRTDAQAHLQQASGYAVAELRSWHQEHLRSANELARQTIDRTLSDPDHLQQHLASTQRLLPDLLRVKIFDADGRLIVTSPSPGSLPGIANSRETEAIADASNWPHFKMARQTLQPILSGVVPEQLPTQVIWNVPIVQGQQLVGMIVAEISLEHVQTLLQQSANHQNVNITLVGRNRSVIFSSRGDRQPGQPFDPAQDSDIERLGTDFYQWFPRRTQLVMVRWMNSFFVQEMPVATGLPWTLVVEASAQPDVRSIQTIYSRNLALLLAIALLALLVSALISRRMVHPLSRLAAVTTNLPEKLLDGQPIEWPDSPVTEIAFLVQNFRTMGSTLTQQFQAIQQSLSYEALVKRITDSVRDSLDESQILQTAVQALGQELAVVCCDAALYNPEQTSSTICYEHTTSLPSARGISFEIPNQFSDVHELLLRGESSQFCFTMPHPVRPIACTMTVLACPILDDQGPLGDLWLFKPPGSLFSDPEVRLVQQVANQCAIALRQARLYEAAQIQVKALEDLHQLKDDFLSTVSHELRTPITNIKMAIKMLRLSQQDDRREQYFKILQAECDREAALINDLLDLQRLASGTRALNLEPIHLQDWVLHIVESFEERTRNRQQILQIEIPEELPVITSDSDCLERILTELLNNACKYTPPGEHIRVSARTISPPGLVNLVDNPTASPDLPLLANLDLFVLDVCNSGVEIPANEIDHIFEKFYRVPGIDRWKQGGTGLGLALVQKMTEHLGGSIQVASTARQTCFTVALPVAPIARS